MASALFLSVWAHNSQVQMIQKCTSHTGTTYIGTRTAWCNPTARWLQKTNVLRDKPDWHWCCMKVQSESEMRSEQQNKRKKRTTPKHIISVTRFPGQLTSALPIGHARPRTSWKVADCSRKLLLFPTDTFSSSPNVPRCNDDDNFHYRTFCIPLLFLRSYSVCWKLLVQFMHKFWFQIMRYCLRRRHHLCWCVVLFACRLRQRWCHSNNNISISSYLSFSLYFMIQCANTTLSTVSCSQDGLVANFRSSHAYHQTEILARRNIIVSMKKKVRSITRTMAQKFSSFLFGTHCKFLETTYPFIPHLSFSSPPPSISILSIFSPCWHYVIQLGETNASGISHSLGSLAQQQNRRMPPKSRSQLAPWATPWKKRHSLSTKNGASPTLSPLGQMSPQPSKPSTLFKRISETPTTFSAVSTFSCTLALHGNSTKLQVSVQLAPSWPTYQPSNGPTGDGLSATGHSPRNNQPNKRQRRVCNTMVLCVCFAFLVESRGFSKNKIYCLFALRCCRLYVCSFLWE